VKQSTRRSVPRDIETPVLFILLYHTSIRPWCWNLTQVSPCLARIKGQTCTPLPRAKGYAQVFTSQTLDCAVHHVLRIVHVLSRLLQYLRVNAAGDHLAHIRHSVGDYQSLDDSCCLRLQLRWKEVHTQTRCVRGELVVFWADTTARSYTSSAAVDGTGIPGQRCKGPGSARACS
jgi:hypothetical protein